MKYNLANKSEVDQAFEHLTQLAGKESKVEIKKIVPRRTLNQNSYLHLIIGAFGAHFGYTLEEAKQIYKEINKSIYYYEKENRGKKLTFVRSSADLNKEEMARSIDKFREASEQAGYPLPLATDQNWLMSLENAIEQSKHYL